MLSTLYILAIVLLTAVPCHFYLGTYGLGPGDPLVSFGFRSWIESWLFAGMVASVVLGVVTTTVPLVIGIRAFRRIEF